MARANFRADVQMLRVIAVGLVILDHAALLQRLPGSPRGGFIGVDIFFVISGFLITSHLVNERLTTGKISFRKFYERRARRILPMAVVVVVVVMLISYVLFWTSQANQYALDGVWSLLFISNIAFAISGTDYFASSAPSIFQHFWSLSVEEQFYIVWPFVILLGGVLAAKVRRPRLVIGLTAAAVGLLSFGWACFETNVAPTAAYFSTSSRAFEFAAGAVLAIGAASLARLPQGARLVMAGFGLVGLVLSVWMVDPGSGFPGPAAILPVVGTLLVIAAGTGRIGGLRIPLLTSRPVSYLGGISYSLYLWHWPVIVIARSTIPSKAAAVAVALVVTLGLSVLSYRFVEQAVLRSSWLQRETRDTTKHPWIRRGSAMLVIGVVSSAALVGGASIVTRVAAQTPTEAFERSADEPAAVAARVDALQVKIGDSEKTATWNDVSPAIDALGPIVPDAMLDCWTPRVGELASCELGDPRATRSVVLLGDSIAMTYSSALRKLATEMDFTLRIFAKPGCPAAEMTVLSTDGSVYSQCDDFRSQALDEVQRLQPDLILMASARDFNLAPGSDLKPQEALAQGWTKTLERVSSVGPVAILTPPVDGPETAVCANRFNGPADCGTGVSTDWLANLSTTSAAAQPFDATVIDTAAWFCTLDGVCPAVVDGTIVRRDRTHLTVEYSESLVPLLGGWLSRMLETAA
ncbi:acyltransferase [Plantibacter sp. CFBP 8798]|uniref:acyltransferase family protein n=1 Tax=Plantibacter sp. CFBP 8798 TaxID=2775268 RepID=UPI001784A734|nr:acyltransferase family protein [Plantibacter sp. CFBP 8798]MBD8467498.1 acyltransferase [Plantibacter sp. CFBP 8798]